MSVFRLKRQIMTHTAQGRLTGHDLDLPPDRYSVSCSTLVNPKTMSLLWTRDVGVRLLVDFGGDDVYRRPDHSQDREYGTFNEDRRLTKFDV